MRLPRRPRQFQQKLQRFGALGPADRRLVLGAIARLAVARIELAVMPFEKLAARLSKRGDRSARDPDPALPGRVGFAVRAAAGNVPFRADCFPQALAARALLRRHGYAPTIHLGVERRGGDQLAGHAWLTCGDIVVVGGDDLERYTEVHRF